MTYIKVQWKHSFPDEPVTLYSELTAERWETRKIEVFRDGRCGYADSTETAGGTKLGKEPIPNLSEIAADPQFEPIEISKDDFERVWVARRGAKSTR